MPTAGATGDPLDVGSVRRGRIVPLQETRSDSIGTLTLKFENDTFSDGSDNNFTAGFGSTWTSAAIDSLSKSNWFRARVENDFAFLPTIADSAYSKFIQFSVNMEMYTAQDTSDPDPPQDAHPYSSIIALDSSIYSINEESMHGYILRLGLVGPATGGEGIQDWMHEATGRPLAAAWHAQLENEPLLNLFYIYQKRLLRSTGSGQGFGYDLSINGGGGFGNYYIGANAGLQVRVGFALPANFERSSPIIFDEDIPNRRIAGGPFSFYIFAQSTAIFVGRYLPIDGNTFTSSRSGARDDIYSQFIVGAMLAYGHFVLTWRKNFFGSDFQNQEKDHDYSAITLSYVFF